MSEWMDRKIGKRLDEWEEYMDELLGGWVDGWVSGWMNG